jgi:hypothetical protein
MLAALSGGELDRRTVRLFTPSMEPPSRAKARVNDEAYPAPDFPPVSQLRSRQNSGNLSTGRS